MTFTAGGVDVATVSVGATPADAVYLGSEKVWPTGTGGGPVVLGAWEHQGIKGLSSIIQGMFGAQTNNAYFDINIIDYHGASKTGRFYVGQVLDIDGHTITVTSQAHSGGRDQLTFAEYTPHQLSDLLVPKTVYDIVDTT